MSCEVKVFGDSARVQPILQEIERLEDFDESSPLIRQLDEKRNLFVIHSQRIEGNAVIGILQS